MKKMLFAAGLCLAATFPIAVSAQVPAVPKTEEYCVMHTQGTSKGFTIQVDYGKQPLRLSDKEKDTAGNDLVFISGADALNYLNAQGWELVTVYIGTAAAGIVTYQSPFYVMRRRIQH